SGSSRMAYKTSASSSRISRSKAFRASGRLSVTVVTPSVVLTNKVLYSCGIITHFCAANSFLDTQISPTLQSAAAEVCQWPGTGEPLGVFEIVGYNADERIAVPSGTEDSMASCDHLCNAEEQLRELLGTINDHLKLHETDEEAYGSLLAVA